jgi:hypothetical protein
MNAHAPAVGSFYEEIQHALDLFSGYCMKMLLYFSTTIRTEDISNQQQGMRAAVQKGTTYNGVRSVSLAPSELLTVKSASSRNPTFMNTLGARLIGKNTVACITEGHPLLGNEPVNTPH